MKKLMIAVAAVAMAAAAQAASIQWKAQTTVNNGKGDSSVPVANGTIAYLFMASPTGDVPGTKDPVLTYTSITRQALLAEIEKGTSLASLYDTYGIGNTVTLTDGKNTSYNDVSSSVGNAQGGEVAKYYMVLTDGKDNYFFSKEFETQVQGLDKTQVSITGTATTSKSFIDAADLATAANSGWVAASVPEPTSGLLLVLGLGALALRRRRA